MIQIKFRNGKHVIIISKQNRIYGKNFKTFANNRPKFTMARILGITKRPSERANRFGSKMTNLDTLLENNKGQNTFGIKQNS